jgi:hypothetical protein
MDADFDDRLLPRQGALDPAAMMDGDPDAADAAWAAWEQDAARDSDGDSNPDSDGDNDDIDLDWHANDEMPLEELVGLIGPMDALINNLLWIIVINAAVVFLFAKLPALLGEVVADSVGIPFTAAWAHVLLGYESPPTPLILVHAKPKSPTLRGSHAPCPTLQLHPVGGICRGTRLASWGMDSGAWGW